ncbi:hypothetical protein ABWJ92_21470 [Streptomyces sp. NPDC000609]|uniref:hypothetical protein n=1 Tax=Streptomyces sp. NPDC000609 TaxID=3160957 RepID=UPI00339504E7
MVARIGRTGNTRWWLAAGTLVGVGAEFNHLAAIFGPVLLAATLLGMACLAMTVLWVVGLRFLWRSVRPVWRCLVIAYAVLCVLFAVTTGAQVYYLGGLYVCLPAAGTVGPDGWLRARPDRLRGLMTATAVSAALSAVIVLPVPPPSGVAWTYGVGGIPGKTLGRPQLVGTVQQAWTGLPPAQRANAVLFAADRSEAATLPNPQGLHNIAWGGQAYVCTGPAGPGARSGPNCGCTPDTPGRAARP